MTANVQSLATDFPIWYREVSVEADESRQALRIEGIKLLAKDADRDLVEGLVRLAFGIDRQPPLLSVFDRISQGFRDKDPRFDAAVYTHELQLLAGACLVEVFRSPDEIGDIAALNVSTAYLGRVRKTDLPMDLATITDQMLDQRSVDARFRPDLDEFGRAPRIMVGESFSAPAEEEDGEDFDSSDLAKLSNEVQTGLRSIADRQSRMVKSLEQFIKVQDEELQVLWWFLGGRSTELDCDFAKVKSTAQPLVFGKEMADQTCILPGLRTVRSLMARAGLNAKSKLSLPEMVNGSPVDWLNGLMDNSPPSPVTQPLHFAISRRLEVEDDKSWIDAWSSVSGISASQKFDVLDLGEIFYREQLLRKFS